MIQDTSYKIRNVRYKVQYTRYLLWYKIQKNPRVIRKVTNTRYKVVLTDKRKNLAS